MNNRFIYLFEEVCDLTCIVSIVGILGNVGIVGKILDLRIIGKYFYETIVYCTKSKMCFYSSSRKWRI